MDFGPPFGFEDVRIAASSGDSRTSQEIFCIYVTDNCVVSLTLNTGTDGEHIIQNSKGRKLNLSPHDSSHLG